MHFEVEGLDDKGFLELTTPFFLSPPDGERNSLTWKLSEPGKRDATRSNGSNSSRLVLR